MPAEHFLNVSAIECFLHISLCYRPNVLDSLVLNEVPCEQSVCSTINLQFLVRHAIEKEEFAHRLCLLLLFFSHWSPNNNVPCALAYAGERYVEYIILVL